MTRHFDHSPRYEGHDERSRRLLFAKDREITRLRRRLADMDSTFSTVLALLRGEIGGSLAQTATDIATSLGELSARNGPIPAAAGDRKQPGWQEGDEMWNLTLLLRPGSAEAVREEVAAVPGVAEVYRAWKRLGDPRKEAAMPSHADCPSRPPASTSPGGTT